MGYDVKIHIPARLENLLNVVENGGSIEQFDLIIKDIQGLLNNPGFNEDLEEYKQDREKQYKQEEVKAVEAIKSAMNQTDLEGIMNQVQNIINEYQSNVMNISRDYIDVIKTYIIEFLPNLDFENVR